MIEDSVTSEMLYNEQITVQCNKTHTHTHNCFMALLDFVPAYPGEPAAER